MFTHINVCHRGKKLVQKVDTLFEAQKWTPCSGGKVYEKKRISGVNEATV